MEIPKKEGISFGITSGTITTLGLIVGLYSGTHSKLAVVGGILILAIADSLSDALGIHTSEESRKDPVKNIWKTTIYTFLTKFFYTLTFVIPILLFNLKTAIIINVIYGLIGLTLLNFYFSGRKNRFKAIREHVSLAIAVIIITYVLGILISNIFGNI